MSAKVEVASSADCFFSVSLAMSSLAFLIISFASAIFCSGVSVVPGADVDDGPNGVDEPDGDVD